MKDNKKPLLAALAVLVCACIYNLCVFLLPLDHRSAFWGAYIFTMIAFAAELDVLIVFMTSRSKDKFFDLPLLVIGTAYLVAQIGTGITVMLKHIPFLISIIIQAIIFAVFAARVILSVLGRDHAVRTEENIASSTDFMRTLTNEAEHIYVSETDPEIKSQLKMLYEAVRYSDPVSGTAEVRMLDEQINSAFEYVKEVVSAGSAEDVKREVKRSLDLIGKRNTVCRSSK